MAWIDNLKNIEPIVINESLINNSDLLITNTISNANDTTGGLWFIFVIIAFFIWLNYILMDKQGSFRFEFPRSLLISSGWCLSISIIAAITTITTTILPIIWFSTILFFSVLAVMRRKETNQ